MMNGEPGMNGATNSYIIILKADQSYEPYHDAK